MKKTVSILLSVLIAVSLIGCTATENFGTGVDKSTPSIKVKDIFLDSSIIGKTVTLQGTIASQCVSNGCWFVLQDDTGQIFVNLAPANMELPPRMNKTARVTGVIYPVQGELQLIAKGVEVI